jgi:molecular chaperone IbpA
MTYVPRHFPTLVGFETLFDELDTLVSLKQPTYPPYNIRRLGEKYYIEMAVAGLKREEIDIEVANKRLKISANRRESEKVQENEQYLHRGIANRSFTNTFTLADNVIVNGADIVDGVLIVELEQLIPEEQKLRKITIGSLPVSTQQLLTEAAK